MPASFFERLGYGFNRLVGEVLGVRPEDTYGPGYARREPATLQFITNIEDVTRSELSHTVLPLTQFDLPNTQKTVIQTNEGQDEQVFSRPTILSPLGNPFGVPRLISGNGDIFQGLVSDEARGVDQIRETYEDTPSGRQQGFAFRIAPDAPPGASASVALSFAGISFLFNALVAGAGRRPVSASVERAAAYGSIVATYVFDTVFTEPPTPALSSFLAADINGLRNVATTGDPIFESADFDTEGEGRRMLVVQIKDEALPGQAATISWEWQLGNYGDIWVPFAVHFTVTNPKF